MDATPLDFADFTARCLALYSTNRYAHKTFCRVRQVLRELAALGCVTTADLTTSTMGSYVSGRGKDANANTTNGLLSSIGAVCTYAVEERWLDRPPSWRRVRLRETPTVVNRPRSYDEVSRLLASVHEARGASWEAGRLCALAWLVALTGVRLGEAVHAWTEDLTTAGPTPSFAVNPARHRLKTVHSARTVPVAAILVAVLAEWVPLTAPGPWLFPGARRRGPWTGGETGRSKSLDHLKAAAAAAGVGRLTWHSLRHSFGTTAVERWDVPLWVLQRVMGHSDLRTTARYLHTDGSPAIAEALRDVAYRQAG